jgi:HTH-type transcriptional regulator/antitoxin HigA
MNIKTIGTEVDYNNALNRLEVIFDAAPNTAEWDELEIIAGLIANYEEVYFPIDLPEPEEAVNFRMEQLNYKGNE